MAILAGILVVFIIVAVISFQEEIATFIGILLLILLGLGVLAGLLQMLASGNGFLSGAAIGIIIIAVIFYRITKS
jgi:hypothetical protein